METIKINDKTYKLDVEKAKSLGILKESKYPGTWTEFLQSQHISTRDELVFLPDEKDAVKSFIRLIILRNSWRNGWEPDWNDKKQKKYAIDLGFQDFCYKIGIFDITYNSSPNIFTFESYELAERFANQFYWDLCNVAKLFYGNIDIKK